MLVEGRLTIQLRGRDDVVLEVGAFFIVPRGVEHRPVADDEVHLLLFEPATTRNTGDVEDERTVAAPAWI